jgi:2-oxoglutarate ferredoxin oxidoreductase subunit gamma
MAQEKIIIAGFCGQGVKSMGQLLVYTAMIENKHAAWLPSYGPELRDGMANCVVVISDKAIEPPIISDDATALIVMNLASLVKFEKYLVPGGKLLINTSSFIKKRGERI